MSVSGNLEISVVGGTYLEQCMRPSWKEVYGSAGRAASAIASMGGIVQLHTFCDNVTRDVLECRAEIEGFKIAAIPITEAVRFDYDHGLDTPRISNFGPVQSSLRVDSVLALSFGMLEGNAIVNAVKAVYDPQNSRQPQYFHANGSNAAELAVVLNLNEARLLAGLQPNASKFDLVRVIAKESRASAVVIKLGALGAVVYEDGNIATVPAFRSQSVWKIGSGDNFAAHFAYRWLAEGRKAAESAWLASKATSYYCQSRGFATSRRLEDFNPEPVAISPRFENGYKPLVYLAGPFFTMAQLWLIEQARRNLRSMGLRVFSPYHDVGHGSARDVVLPDLQGIEKADLVFAIADGMDPGTIFEIGYSRARGKPVCIYCENETPESQKMMAGTECVIHVDYVSAVYQLHWIAASL